MSRQGVPIDWEIPEWELIQRYVESKEEGYTKGMKRDKLRFLGMLKKDIASLEAHMDSVKEKYFDLRNEKEMKIREMAYLEAEWEKEQREKRENVDNC